MRPLLSLLTASLVLLVQPSTAAEPAVEAAIEAAQVRDTRGSFIAVAERMQWLRATPAGTQLAATLSATAGCAQATAIAPPAGPIVIPARYASGNHGPVNPAYEPVVAVYRSFENNAAALANHYLASGDVACAHGLLNQLSLWADANALLDYTVNSAPGVSNQAWYQVEWSLAAASLALSQVVREPALNAAQLGRVIGWLQRASHKQISFPGGPNTCCNNHAYWRGLHATMIGVLANDNALFRWGLGRYAVALHQLADDGSWPLELARHEQALHYQNYALLPLTMIAEIAHHQGLNLYAQQVQGRNLHRAVTFLAGALPAYRATAAAGNAPPMDLRAFVPGSGDLTWAEFYRARFGRDPLGLLTLPVRNARTGGSATLLTLGSATTP